LLRSIPIFAPLAPLTLEQLASHLVPVHVPAGDIVFREGDPGDRFYVVARGDVIVTPGDKPSVMLRRGDHFGEIALLRDVPRTATVTAQTDAELYALDSDDFIAAVTGHAPSAEAADAVIAGYIGSAAAGAGFRGP